MKKSRTKLYIFLIIFFGGSLFLLFNDYGLLKYLSLKNEADTLNKKIERVEKENKNMEAEIDSLERKVPAKIEKVAREKYDMKRRGEKVIKVEEK